MKLSNPTRIKGIINSFDFRFKKNLGQNFLTDANIVNKIVAGAEITEDDLVLEVGPGIGTLTEALSEKAGKVIAVELDQKLIPILQETLGQFENIEIVQGDALKINLDQLITEKSNNAFGKGAKAFKVVANLPYYITTPLVMHFLEEGFNIDSITIMIQREVADRMNATPGSKDYGALTVAVQFYTETNIVTRVPKGAFIPQPEVESTVIRLKRRLTPPVQVANSSTFFKVVKAAFGQRRKTLLNALNNSGWPLTKEDWEEVLRLSNIDGKRRGETLSLQEFASLTNLLERKLVSKD